ncbi:hypothetical protein [Catenulispora subtropica]|uniref:hypothetical protein n=1 Tax=Catenulispora subtropica TaxID=450798 RepID=UPI0031DBBABD
MPAWSDPAAYGATPPQPDADGVTFYKGGVTVRADHPKVTITIGAEARSFARIVIEDFQDPLGALSVTYAGTPRIAAEKGWDCWYVGGFNLLNRRTTACVPLDITIAGDPVVHHVKVPIGITCPE